MRELEAEVESLTNARLKEIIQRALERLDKEGKDLAEDKYIVGWFDEGSGP